MLTLALLLFHHGTRCLDTLFSRLELHQAKSRGSSSICAIHQRSREVSSVSSTRTETHCYRDIAGHVPALAKLIVLIVDKLLSLDTRS